VVKRVLLVDLDDTLIADVAAARAAITGTLRARGVADPAGGVETVLAAAREHWQAYPWRTHPEVARVSSWEALWVDYERLELPAAAARALAGHDRRVWRTALRRLAGDGPSADGAAADFRARRAAAVRPLPGVPAQLDRLGGRHELWLTTDGCRPLQRRKLELSGPRVR
jgi:FMN phosphatase YigB (HAD superfamily)